jgi:uncharacterized protein (DUF58 family)
MKNFNNLLSFNPFLASEWRVTLIVGTKSIIQMKHLSFIFFLGTFIFSNIAAQDATFKIEVSADTLLVGNYFELKYTVENTDGAFESPDLSSFDVIGGPNTSSSFSMINGSVTQSSSYSYYLRPPDIGVYTIPPAFLTTSKDTMATMPIDIIVVPNPEGIIQEPNRPTQRFEHIFPEMDNLNQKPGKKKEAPETIKSKRKKRIF